MKGFIFYITCIEGKSGVSASELSGPFPPPRTEDFTYLELSEMLFNAVRALLIRQNPKLVQSHKLHRI